MDVIVSTIFSPGHGGARAWRDQLLELPQLGLMATADALSTGEEGRAGVRIALEAVRASITREEDVLDRFRRNPTEVLRDRVLTIIEDAIARAAQEVFAYARRFPELRITVDVLLLLEHEAFVGHVGDGRVYLVRRGLVHQLTVDHATPEDEVFGEPEPPGDQDGTAVRPAERRVVRALGPAPAVKVESLCMELGDNDRFVLSTYALHHSMPDGVLHHHFLADPLTTLGPRLAGTAAGVAFAATACQLGGIDPDILDSGRSRLAILQPMPLFAHCTERELRVVAAATHPRKFPRHAVLFRQGDPGTELYLIISGRIRIERDGEQMVTLGPGNAFGEMALLDQPHRSASAITEDPCEVMVISRESFFALLKGNPMLAVKILWNIALRLSANLRNTTAALAEAKGAIPEAPPLRARTPEPADVDIVLTGALVRSEATVDDDSLELPADPEDTSEIEIEDGTLEEIDVLGNEIDNPR